MNFEQYQDYLIDTATSLLSIDSASGFTSNVADYLLKIHRGAWVSCFQE